MVGLWAYSEGGADRFVDQFNTRCQGKKGVKHDSKTCSLKNEKNRFGWRGLDEQKRKVVWPC